MMKTVALTLLIAICFVLHPGCGGSGGGMGAIGGSGGAGGKASGAPGPQATGGAAASADAGGGPGMATGGAPAAVDAARVGDAMSIIDTATAPDGALVSPGGCPALLRCDATPPSPGPARAWRHSAPSGMANHRGRDLFVNPGARQWVIASFHYGLTLLESALGDEEVDIYLLRGCAGAWEKLGSATTTATAAHEAEEGVDDAPGRLYFEIPAGKALALGRHRIRLVVAGDLSATELFIEVVAANTPIFVTDVDGTLTTSENAQALSLFTGSMPDANPGASALLSVLASKGYRPFYLTARPDWLGRTTQDWIASKGFPPGIIHTTLSSGGATGAAAATFKTEELKLLAAKGGKPSFAFGNTSTDADAYNNAAILPLSNRIFFQFTDSAFNGRRIEAYGSLMTEMSGLPAVCQ